MPKKKSQEDLVDRILSRTLGEGTLRTAAGMTAWSILALTLGGIVFIGIQNYLWDI